jgi:hypothetical protein
MRSQLIVVRKISNSLLQENLHSYQWMIKLGGGEREAVYYYQPSRLLRSIKDFYSQEHRAAIVFDSVCKLKPPWWQMPSEVVTFSKFRWPQL